MTESAAFTFRRARSGALAAGLGLAIAIETPVLHLWLGVRHPTWAWSLSVLGVATLVWIVLEYRAMGHPTVRVTSGLLYVAIGHRAALQVPRAQITSAAPATWRDLPDGPDSGYLNATAPASPNVVLTFAPPVRARMVAGLARRSVTRVGLCLDDPTAFLEALRR